MLILLRARSTFIASATSANLFRTRAAGPTTCRSPGRHARRWDGLIRTLPALNNDTALSRPRMPEWLDERIGEKVEEQEEQEEIAAGFE